MAINVKTMGGNALCKTKRSRKINIQKPENPAFERIAITKSLIKGYRYVPQIYKTVQETVDAVIERMADCKALCSTTKELQIKEMQALISRYLNADGRTCIKPEARNFRFCGKEYLIQPDFVYEDETTVHTKIRTKTSPKTKAVSQRKTREYKVPMIEVVNLSAGRTKMSTSLRSRSMDSSVWYSPVALGMLMYGKQVLGKQEGVVKVTFDSLKSANDHNGDFSAPWQVATGATSKKTDHSVSFEVWFDKKGKLIRNMYPYCELFQRYQQTLEKYEQSESCTKENCTKCELHNICNYNHPPKEKDQQVIEKQISDFVLTKEQNDVISAKEGIFRVMAGPGSGKTFCVTQRIIRLIQMGYDPKKILMTTFSRSGVAEMKNRIKQLFDIYGLKADPEEITITTFNGLGNELIQKYYSELGFSEAPCLLDDVEEKKIICEILANNSVYIEGLDYRNPTMKFAVKDAPKGIITFLYDEFNMIRTQMCDSAEMYMQESKQRNLIHLKDESYYAIWTLYDQFASILKSRNFIDYADQSNLVLELLIKGEQTGKNYIIEQYRFEHVIVDEFQDSNDFQMEFIKELISTPSFTSLMVVGDDSQAIYGFRGTSPKNIINMETIMECDVDDFFLTETHRFPQPIADAANEVISLNKNRVKKKIISSMTSGGKPLLKGFKKETDEITYIADCIEKLHEDGVELSDIAVISFKKATLQKIGRALSKKGILALKNSERLLDNSKVNSAIELAEFFNNPDATASLLSYLDAVFDNKILDFSDHQINEMLETNQQDFVDNYFPLGTDQKMRYFISLLDLLNDGTDDTYITFLDKIKEKKRYSVLELIDYILKFKQYDSDDSTQRKGNFDAVELTTAHASKGKEWKYVFTTVSDFDSFRGLNQEELEERRRLLFVAITRAKQFLQVTSAMEKTSDRNLDDKRTNRFYAELSVMDSFTKNFPASA